jgi:TPP-dependent pyruvate/acetoin dehydrogenase alpha subunit
LSLDIEEKFYRSLFRIRRVEEEVARIYPTDKIKSPVHLSIGQEAVAVGVCEALRSDDLVFGTYRGHAFYLAHGGDLKKMIAELYGKETGATKGKGGSMHLVDIEHGVMGTSAVVGTTIPQAVGYALALRIQNRDKLVVSVFGDGAIEEGVFHESMSFASLKRLPMIFVCENNSYAIHAHQRTRQPGLNISDRAGSYGMPAERIENGDVFQIYAKVKKAVDELRLGEPGPRFFEIMTYRWMEHVGPSQDFHFGYRAVSEAEPWFESDQVKLVGGLITATTRKVIEAEVEAEIQDAFAFAEDSPFPDVRELWTDVYQEG